MVKKNKTKQLFINFQLKVNHLYFILSLLTATVVSSANGWTDMLETNQGLQLMTIFIID